MDLVKIDRLHLQAAKAVLALAADGFALQTLLDLALLIPDALALGEYVRTIRTALYRASDNLLRVAKTIDRSGINPVDAAIESGVNGSDRFLIVLRTPGERPARAAHGP